MLKTKWLSLETALKNLFAQTFATCAAASHATPVMKVQLRMFILQAQD
jgi:hypothetical protein